MGPREKRVDDWPSALASALVEGQRTPFAWGQNDCVLFAGTVAEALTGEDPFAAYRNRYATPKGALRIVKKRTAAGTLRAAVTQELGAEIPAIQAQRGDIVLIEVEPVAGFGEALGVCDGAQALFLTEPQGIVAYPMADIACAWPIGA